MDIINLVPIEMEFTIVYDKTFNGMQDMESFYWYKPDKDEDGELVTCHLSYFRQGRVKKICPVPSYNQWQLFFDKLKKIDVFSWGNKNIPEIVKHGLDYETPFWEFKIIYQNGNNFEISGAIQEIPPHFNDFCKAISEFLNLPSFGIDRQKI